MRTSEQRIDIDKPILSDVALQGVIGDFVNKMDPNVECSKAALLAHVLIGIGSMFGRLPLLSIEHS
jgi:hypothetical protein